MGYKLRDLWGLVCRQIVRHPMALLPSYAGLYYTASWK